MTCIQSAKVTTTWQACVSDVLDTDKPEIARFGDV